MEAKTFKFLGLAVCELATPKEDCGYERAQLANPRFPHLTRPPSWDGRDLWEASLIIMGAFVIFCSWSKTWTPMPDTCSSHIVEGGLSLKLNHQPDSCVLFLYRYLIPCLLTHSPKVRLSLRTIIICSCCWHLLVHSQQRRQIWGRLFYISGERMAMWQGRLAHPNCTGASIFRSGNTVMMLRKCLGGETGVSRWNRESVSDNYKG